MFTPTKQQLEELGFTYGNVRCQLQIDKPPFDIWLSYGWGFFIQIGDENRKFYPQSIEDIQTLIKLLTPPNNN